MSYQLADGYDNDVKFVRPAHRLVALHGADVVPVAALGLDGRPHDARPPLPGARATIEMRDADAYARDAAKPKAR